MSEFKNDCNHCGWCGWMETSHEWIDPYCYKLMKVCENITEECGEFKKEEDEENEG